jgi:hypothetical protein
LGVDPADSLSPGALEKVVYAGANAGSFRCAARDLTELAELPISIERVRRVTERIGAERVAEREGDVAHWRELPLVKQMRSPHDDVPQVACVQADGGRMQIRERGAPSSQRDHAQGFWRETKVACLLRMQSEKRAFDPCPTLPESFANIARMAELSRGMKGYSAAQTAEKSGGQEEAVEEWEQEGTRPGRPQVLTRNVVATRAGIEEFGRQVAARAWKSGFAAAPRKVFLADGLACNWSLWRHHFSDYTPVLDFVHAACYVFNAAAAGRPLDAVAAIYRRWAQAVWSGRVAEVLVELQSRQQELGEPQAGDATTHPRHVVAEALTYLANQQSRMQYDQYRRDGLPITSAHIESTIKQINRRVKGSEKFWNSAGAEPMLQLIADYLSDQAPLRNFWRRRPATRTGFRRHT